MTYVGLDLHKKLSTVTTMDAQGKEGEEDSQSSYGKKTSGMDLARVEQRGTFEEMEKTVGNRDESVSLSGSK